jgi:hypothetical protein
MNIYIYIYIYERTRTRWKRRHSQKGYKLGDMSQNSYILQERSWYNEKCLQKFILYFVSLKGVLFYGGGFRLRNAEKIASCLLEKNRKRAGCDGRQGDEGDEE